jgi:hypothetical protein
MHAEKTAVNDFLDGLRTPAQIADQISAATGVAVAARTVWEKAKRLGIGKKIGRQPMIHVDDILKLLMDEKSAKQEARLNALSNRRLAASLRKLSSKKRRRPA